MVDPAPPSTPIYLDSAASTAVRPEVMEAMLPFFTGEFANPSAHHARGRVAHEALEDARANAFELANVEFHRGRVEDVLPRVKRIDLAVADPPRAGIAPRALDGSHSTRIDAGTLARADIETDALHFLEQLGSPEQI